MKACQTLLLTIFLLSCQTAFAQTANSSITIKINRGNYVVSGIVASDSVKNEVAEKVRSQLGSNADFSKISVSSEAKPFQADWLTEFDKSLSKIKTWQSGVVIFSNVRRLTDENYPLLPAEIANAKILLSNGQTVSPKDYKNKLVVLFFLESWASPAFGQANLLNEIYLKTSSRNIEIIGISTETSPDEKKDLHKFFKIHNIQYKYGWMDSELMPNFVEISKLNGIPQTFIILNGRLHAVFTGGGPKATEKLKETILKTLDENNL